MIEMESNNKIYSSELLKYIPRTTLDKVCVSISETTGVFTGIEDYQGVMVSLSTGERSCRLCRQRRVKMVDTMTCQRIDLFASIEASKKGSAIMYVCPYGLVDMCAPIIIDGRLEGAIFIGQILTDEKNMDSLQKFNIPVEDNHEGEKELLHQYQKEIKNLKIIPFDLVCLYLKLLDTAAKYLSESGTCSMFENDIRQMKRDIRQMEAEQEQLKAENLAASSQLSSHQAVHDFIMASLNSVNQLAVLEEAPETRKGMQNLMQLLQYVSDEKNVFTILEKEFAYTEKYFELQRIIHSHVKVNFDMKARNMEVVVPQLLLIQLIENVYNHAFTTETENPQIYMSITEENNYIVVSLQDNGIGMPDYIVNGLLQYMLDSTNIPESKGQLFLILRNMKYLYRDSFRFDVDSRKNGGTVLQLSIPDRRF